MALNQEMIQRLNRAFNPESVAIVGASNNPNSFGYLFMDWFIQAGYSGKLYPVNPKGEEIIGCQSYKNLTDIPGEIDYVICCIAGNMVPDLIRQCAAKNARVVHIFTGRMSESGDAKGMELEMEIARLAKANDISIIGPNCVGIYHPKAKLTTNYDQSMVPGPVGAIFQSGGMSWDYTRYASLRGVTFSKVISLGNAIDLNESDYLDYLAQDEETKVIVMYLEGVKEGRRFFKTLREAASRKPIIALKGGKSESGTKRTMSHTASLAGSYNTWGTLFHQCNVTQAEDLTELIDLTVAFQFMAPLTGKKAGVVGGGGGKSVLSADEVERAGFNLIPLPPHVRNYIMERNPEMVDWMGNPVDLSLTPGTKMKSSEFLRRMAESPEFDLLFCATTEDQPSGEKGWTDWVISDTDEFLKLAAEKLKPIVLTIGNPELTTKQVENWRWRTLLEQRERMIASQLPTFSSVSRAALAVNKLVNYYQRRNDTEG